MLKTLTIKAPGETTYHLCRKVRTHRSPGAFVVKENPCYSCRYKVRDVTWPPCQKCEAWDEYLKTMTRI